VGKTQEAYNEHVKNSVQSYQEALSRRKRRIFKEERVYYKLTTSVDGEV
jgi:hypothetical protein